MASITQDLVFKQAVIEYSAYIKAGKPYQPTLFQKNVAKNGNNT